MLIYTFLGFVLSKAILFVSHYYKLLENKRIYRYDKFFFYSFSFKKIIFVYICNIIVWNLIWFIEGIHFYSFLLGIIASILLAISFIDYQYFLIPNTLTCSLFIIGLLFICFHYTTFIDAFFGFFSVSSIFYILYIVTKKKGIGGGDIKLMASCGVFLGVTKSIIALEIACFLAFFIQGIWKRKKQNIFAFGPYLSIGILLSFFIEKMIIFLFL